MSISFDDAAPKTRAFWDGNGELALSAPRIPSFFRGVMEEIETRFGDAERFELFTGHRSERNLRFYEKRGYRAFRSERVTGNLTLVFLEKRCGA